MSGRFNTSSGYTDALSRNIAFPPAAYNNSVALGLIAAIDVGAVSKNIGFPKASVISII